MKYIQSAKNPQVKQWKKLLKRKERDITGTFLVEGFHLVEEALKENRVKELMISEEKDIPKSWNVGNCSVYILPPHVIGDLTDTQTPQGIVAVCYQEEERSFDSLGLKKLLLLDEVQDPGNLGTMIRTADAAGMDAVIIGHSTVDPYNPKVLRSAQGSHFHLPIIHGKLDVWMKELKENNIPVYGTALEGGKEYQSFAPLDEFALLVGNEGNGVNKELLTQTTANLYIPLYGKSESLNVAVAAGILLYYLRNE
ncbi:RNA methyltransferase [Cytobacillus sp. FSL R5-0569]|uniref:TrmH family RNA methyltransferase n=1 Tax=Cytobacillus sp. FSL R5-0569 TaxID=2921649 RepID=UPI0030FA83F7